MDLRKAALAQLRLATRLILEWEGREVRLIAGADFSYDLEKKRIASCIVVLDALSLKLVESSVAVCELKVPYIPGFLSLREAPSFFAAFRKIRNLPDVTLVDGNGIAHPRKMGLASYVGVLLDIPTIGCAKSAFFPYRAPALKKGSMTIFRNEKNEKVGVCVRTRSGVKPVFVSPGHRTDFSISTKMVLECSRFRIPEPLRIAHLRAQRVFSPQTL